MTEQAPPPAPPPLVKVRIDELNIGIFALAVFLVKLAIAAIPAAIVAAAIYTSIGAVFMGLGRN